jgi:hypothetical protein
MYLNSNYNYIIEYLSKKKKNIEDQFNNWLSIKKDYYNLMTITPRELNERYKQLSKSFNSYCKINYIDYNFIVDQILQMSLPYSEGKQGTISDTNKLAEYTFYEPSIRGGVNLYTKDREESNHNQPTMSSRPLNINQKDNYNFLNIKDTDNKNINFIGQFPNNNNGLYPPTTNNYIIPTVPKEKHPESNKSIINFRYECKWIGKI